MTYEGLLLFDGDCSFCHRGIQFILKHDKHAYFSFASLQGDTGHEVKKHYQISNQLDSVILIQNGRYYHKSTAVLRICKQLNALYPLLYSLIVIPRPIRNLAYDFIAKNRQFFSKKHTACVIPSPENQKRFLD